MRSRAWNGLGAAGKITRAVAAAPLLAACAGTADHSDVSSLPLAEVERDLRIGHLDDPELSFGLVHGLTVGPEGHIFSLHRTEAEVRRWRPEGEPAGRVGGRGEGPGEFVAPGRIGVFGDSLWVADYRRFRASFYDPAGEYLGSFAMGPQPGEAPPSVALPPAQPEAPLRDGSVFARTATTARDIALGDVNRRAVVRLLWAEGRHDTLAVVPVGAANILAVEGDGGSMTYGSQPFDDSVVAQGTAAGDGVLVLDRTASEDPVRGEFRLTLIDLSGDTAFHRAYPYTPVPIRPDEVDRAIEEQAESLQEFMGEQLGTTVAQWRGWVGEALHRPPHHPPVARLLAGADGTVWLRLNPSGEEGAEWLVLDRDGEPLVRVRVPEGIGVRWASRDMLLGTEHDELGVEYIVRYMVG